MVFGRLWKAGGKSWVLEVVKMSLYMSFPVGCFYFFNRPEVFKRIGYTKRNYQAFSHLDTTNDPEDMQKFRQLKYNIAMAREEKWKEQQAARSS